MSVQRAVVEERAAALSSAFGNSFLVARYGEKGAAAVRAALGVYKSGPRRGLPRGYIYWRRCSVGGWWHDDSGRGRVVRPGTRDVAVGLSRTRTERAIGDRREAPSDLTDVGWLDWLARGLEVVNKEK